MENALRDGLHALGTRVQANSARHGWWDTTDKGLAIALIHSELSECLGSLRKPHPDEHCPEFTNEVIEMADAVIRIVDYCRRYTLPLADAILAKVAFNDTRPHKHGKEF